MQIKYDAAIKERENKIMNKLDKYDHKFKHAEPLIC